MSHVLFYPKTVTSEWSDHPKSLFTVYLSFLLLLYMYSVVHLQRIR